MVDLFLDLINLSPGEAKVVGATALVAVVVTDLLASADSVDGNTPRDWLVWLTQWKSEALWRSSVRKGWSRERVWARRFPLNYLPLCGAAFPYLLGVLLGHFFHPGLEPLLGPGGTTGLVIAGGQPSCLPFWVSTAGLDRVEARSTSWPSAGSLLGSEYGPSGPPSNKRLLLTRVREGR